MKGAGDQEVPAHQRKEGVPRLMQWPAGVNPGNTLRAIGEYRVQIPGRLLVQGSLGLSRYGPARCGKAGFGNGSNGSSMVRFHRLPLLARLDPIWFGWARYWRGKAGLGKVFERVGKC